MIGVGTAGISGRGVFKCLQKERQAGRRFSGHQGTLSFLRPHDGHPDYALEADPTSNRKFRRRPPPDRGFVGSKGTGAAFGPPTSDQRITGAGFRSNHSLSFQRFRSGWRGSGRNPRLCTRPVKIIPPSSGHLRSPHGGPGLPRRVKRPGSRAWYTALMSEWRSRKRCSKSISMVCSHCRWRYSPPAMGISAQLAAIIR